MEKLVMFMRRVVILLSLMVTGISINAVAETGPDRGKPASEADIKNVFWTVFPDGENLPQGSGTALQGKELYSINCAGCHGEQGEGPLANRLVGRQNSLLDKKPVKTIGSYWPYATTVFDYIRRSMPFTEPMSLSNDDYYALTAFLLYANGIIGEDKVIDKKSLPKVLMPNRNGFVDAHRGIPAEYKHKK